VDSTAFESKYQKEMLASKAKVDSLNKVNNQLSKTVGDLKQDVKTVNTAYDELKSVYHSKTRFDKNNQARKRFSGKNEVLKQDSNLVCFDSTGVDSINKLAMEHDRLAVIVPIKDSIISTQDVIISNDSIAKSELTHSVERAENYGKHQKSEADRHKKGKRFWMGLSGSLIIVHGIIVYTLITR
jgi:hypothetical protein